MGGQAQATRSDTAAPPRHSGGVARKYRPEVQGLRALAVLLVVAYHVWLDRVSGGVDVFFVVSGFLITGGLFRSGVVGRFGFRVMWARMIKRLFPAALTVLVVTMAVGVAVLPEARWFQTIREVVASALYVENWQLAADSVDYFAQHNTASVVQHFWSLSIQGQFYVVWPLLVAGVWLIARLCGHRLWPWLTGTLVVVGGSSLALSVVLTASNQPLAYFHSATRVWEFALGGLLALLIDRITLPRLVRILLGWIGVLGLVSCGLVLQVGTVFPGYAALWPTLSACLIILAGATGSRAGADRFLSSRPLEYLGNLSYTLYLWHWPVLIYYLLLRDQTQVGILGGTAIITLSLCLSLATYHLIEKPARDSTIGTTTRWGAYRFGILTLIPVLLIAASWQWLGGHIAQSSAVDVSTAKPANGTEYPVDPNHPGAMAHTEGFRYTGETGVRTAPSAVTLPDDWARLVEPDCRVSEYNEELEICASDVRAPKRDIVVVGDSHAQQYLGVFKPIADKQNWRITTMLRGGCPFSTQSETRQGSERCVDWNAAALREIIEMRPDAVFTMATRNVRVGLTEQTPPGFVEQWRKLEASGIPLVGLRDNPRFTGPPADCVAEYGKDAKRCATSRATLLAKEAPYQRIPNIPSNVRFLDFSDYLCTATSCPPVIGNVYVYMDNNHLSATYMSTMANIVDERVHAVLGW